MKVVLVETVEKGLVMIWSRRSALMRNGLDLQ